MPLAVSNGTLLDYEITGSGPPLVLIRGLSRSRRFWLGLDERLAERFTVLTLDNRGVGKSSKPPGLWKVADMADDTAAVIRDAGFERAHVFGMSLGGMIAQELALRHPSLVDHLALGCTTPGTPEGRKPPLRAVLSLALAIVGPLRLSNGVVAKLTLSAAHRAAHPETEQAWFDLVLDEGISKWAVIKQILAVLKHRTGPRLGSIAAPTLVLTGDADELIDSRNSEYLTTHIPSARQVVLSGAGHDFPAEQPEETAQAIEAFCLGTD